MIFKIGVSKDLDMINLCILYKIKELLKTKKSK